MNADQCTPMNADEAIQGWMTGLAMGTASRVHALIGVDRRGIGVHRRPPGFSLAALPG
jgi:hypothetical protein